MQAEVPQQRHQKEPIRPKLRLFFLAGLFAVIGITVALLRFGNPYHAIEGQQVIVKESFLPSVFTPKWRVIDDEYAVVLPGVQLAHPVNTASRIIQTSIVASAQNGLKVTIGPIEARYHIPINGALDLIQTLGRHEPDHERFTRAIIVVAARAALAELSTLFVQTESSIESLSKRTQLKAGDALAHAGIVLESLDLNRVRYQDDAAGLIARLNAANARMQDAQEQAEKDNRTAAEKIGSLVKHHEARLQTLVDEYTLAVHQAEKDAEARLERAESEFQKAQQSNEIRRRIDAIRLESLEYGARQAARGLKARIDEARNWPAGLHQRALAEQLLGNAMRRNQSNVDKQEATK